MPEGGKKMREKKIPVVDDKTITLCKEHRKKLDLPEDHYIGTKEDPWWNCGSGLMCYDDCPVPEERDKAYPPKKKDGKWGMGFNSDGSRTINTDVFEPVDKPKKDFVWIDDAGSGEAVGVEKKPKKFSREVEDFLWLQSRVLDKLAFHPDLYRVLDRLSYDEIMDRLAGKTGLETVPKQLGGTTDAEYSPETKKYFADLEKKFAKEDEKKKIEKK